MTHVDDDLASRFADASDAVAARLHDVNQTLLRRGTAGFDVARDFGGEMLGGARRMTRSSRDLVVERPLESVLLVAAAGFAIGWLIRRMREPAARVAAARTSRTARRKPRSK